MAMKRMPARTFRMARTFPRVSYSEAPGGVAQKHRIDQGFVVFLCFSQTHPQIQRNFPGETRFPEKTGRGAPISRKMQKKGPPQIARPATNGRVVAAASA